MKAGLFKVMSLVLVFCIMLSQVANAATDTLKESLTSYQLPVRDLNGNVIGTQNTTLRLELSKEKNVETVTMFDETTYNFFKDEDVYKKVYKNGSRVTKLEKQANGEFFINGSKVNLTINETKASGASPRAVDSGGKEWLTYYTNFSDNPDLYECLGYPSANNFLDYGTGTKLDRFVKPIAPYTMYKLNDFKMYANSVANARSNINTASVTLTAAIGTLVLTWETVIGAMVGTGGAAVAAYQIYVASQDGKDAMASAYNVLKGWQPGVNT